MTVSFPSSPFDLFVPVEPMADMQSAVDEVLSSQDMDYTPGDIYEEAEREISQLEQKNGSELSSEEKAAIRNPLVCKGKRHVYLKEDALFVLFYISRLKVHDNTGLHVQMDLNQVRFRY